MTATVARIRVYPIKALDALEVDAVAVASGGALVGDRRFALVEAEGERAGTFVNGKNEPAIHRVRARWGPDLAGVTLSDDGDAAGEGARFALEPGGGLEAWFASRLGRGVRLLRNDENGFPDDLEAWGPTVVSRASLETVAGWFPGLTVEEVRRRFRANIEIEGVEPFWEDRLFEAAGAVRPFHLGEVRALGTNPCQRCVVPSRDPATGEPMTGFQKTFSDRRRDCLPPWAEATRFNHFYRFAVNTRIPPSEAGKVIRVGDVLAIDG